MARPRKQRPNIPQAAPPTELPAVNLYRLSGADLRDFLKLRDADAKEREELGFDLLEKAVEGGLSAIPFPYIGEYIRQLNDLLAEAVNPNG